MITHFTAFRHDIVHSIKNVPIVSIPLTRPKKTQWTGYFQHFYLILDHGIMLKLTFLSLDQEGPLFH